MINCHFNSFNTHYFNINSLLQVLCYIKLLRVLDEGILLQRVNQPLNSGHHHVEFPHRLHNRKKKKNIFADLPPNSFYKLHHLPTVFVCVYKRGFVVQGARALPSCSETFGGAQSVLTCPQSFIVSTNDGCSAVWTVLHIESKVFP